MTVATIQPDATAGVDAYISNGANANQNFGSAVTLTIGTAVVVGVSVFNRALIRIDLSSIGRRPRIGSALLTLAHSGGGNIAAGQGTFHCYRLTRTNWGEGTATWNTFDGATPWTTAGGDFTTDNAAAWTGGVGDDMVFDVTAMVAAMLDDGLTQADFLVVGPEAIGANAYKTPFASDDATAATRPKLVVNYTPKPVVELIGVELFDRLRKVTKANGYAVDLVPDRPRRNGGFVPRHLLALLAQSDATLDDVNSTGSYPTGIARVQTFEVGVMVLADEQDATPADELINLAVAEVERAITAPTNWHTMGGLAHGARLGAHIPFPPEALEDGYDGKSVQIHVSYRVLEGNPYQPAY